MRDRGVKRAIEALGDAQVRLRTAWQATATGWRDGQRTQLGHQHVAPIDVATSELMRALRDLDDAMVRAARELGENDA